MKRLRIILLVTIIICPYMVNAATYNIPSESYYVDTLNDNEELLDEELRYKFYKETKEYTEEYYIEGENPKAYPYQSGEYIVTEESEYQKDYPIEYPNRIIKSKNIYVYKKRNKIKSLYIKNIKASNNLLHINEIRIYNKNKLISYKPNCHSCESIENMYDDKNHTSTKIQNIDELAFDFKEEYYTKDITIDIYISDPIGTETTSFNITDNNNLNIFEEMNIYTKNQNSYKLSFDLKDYSKENLLEKDKIYKEEVLEDTDYELIDEYKVYSYQDIKYRYYKLGKEYLDDYYKEKEGYIKDDTNYKSYYKVRYQNKIILKDNYQITNRNYNLYDMIEDSTINTQDISIESSIDINKNGLYKVTFSYNNYKIDQYVIVDIKDQVESIVFTNRSDMQKAKKITSKEKPKALKQKSIIATITYILLSYIKI